MVRAAKAVSKAVADRSPASRADSSQDKAAANLVVAVNRSQASRAGSKLNV